MDLDAFYEEYEKIRQEVAEIMDVNIADIVVRFVDYELIICIYSYLTDEEGLKYAEKLGLTYQGEKCGYGHVFSYCNIKREIRQVIEDYAKEVSELDENEEYGLICSFNAFLDNMSNIFPEDD